MSGACGSTMTEDNTNCTNNNNSNNNMTSYVKRVMELAEFIASHANSCSPWETDLRVLEMIITENDQGGDPWLFLIQYLLIWSSPHLVKLVWDGNYKDLPPVHQMNSLTQWFVDAEHCVLAHLESVRLSGVDFKIKECK